MTPRRVLITGAGGHLGRALLHELREAPGIECVGLTRAQLDVTDQPAVEAAVQAHAAGGWVLHCAALTDTARCERERDVASAVNTFGAGYVADAARAHSARMLHISTNEVFDGAASEPYAENAATNAINVYGETKAEAEALVMQQHPTAIIVRTAWLYSEHGGFVAKVLAAARGGGTLDYVTDEIATPTSAQDLAGAIRALIDAEAAPGVYHLTNNGEASRCDWAREILRLAGDDPARVQGTTTADLRAKGYDGPRKPPYSVLANTRASALGITMRDWRDALRAHVRQETGARG